MKKITITGTKGKSTVSAILAQVLASIEPHILKVDTSGAYVNGKLAISKQLSQKMWDLVPTVAPGRFLYLLSQDSMSEIEVANLNHDQLPGLAILEASLGCGTASGLGYYGHNIGVFTNVFEDHLGSRDDLQDRQDIGQSKKFVFSRINHDGTAVFNADDDIVVSLLDTCKQGVKWLPFGVSFKHFDLQGHLETGGYAVGISDFDVVLHHGSSQKSLFDLRQVGWTFQGAYEPSVYNLLAVTATILAHCDMRLPVAVKRALLASQLDHYSGRLTLLKNQQDVSVLADYAHEKQSLRKIAELANTLKATEANKVIGVLRLAWDRDKALIQDTAKFIADAYDSFIIYDKIDGYWRVPSKRYRTYQRQFHQKVGKISEQLSGALVKERGAGAVQRVLREDEALIAAAKIAKPGDVVVFIVNDDIERSIGFARQYFGADFV
jgi:UDP-N-acetylmuramyl tripeptide synthase